MSVRMMSLVWELDLPDSEKLVLLALADCANDEGGCWPSVETISRKCSKSERTVQNCIRTLCVKGHLTRRERHATSCYYTVHPIVRLTDPAETAPRKDCTYPPQPLHPTPAAAAPKPSKNHQGTYSVSNETGCADPVKQVFDLGVGILMAHGETERSARSLIGKYRKAKSDGEVLTALLECRAKAISNPVEWLEKRLQGARWVSKSGYEYRGSDEDVLRQAEKRHDMDTYWAVHRVLRDRKAAA